MQSLLAQVMIESPHVPFAWYAVFLLAAIVAVPVLLSLFMATIHWHRYNERDHIERMRMIEMGLPVLPRDRSTWPKALVCIAIGAGVPLVAFSCTLMAYTVRSNAADELWVAPGVVSGLSVIGASLLAASLFARRASQEVGTAEAAGRDAKPVMDPDAFDVAGRRG